MRDALFTGFGLFTIVAAMGVVFARNAVYSAACLILSFFGLAALFVLWGNPFLGVLQVLIYTGAIVVLFVFVVMLIDVAKGSRNTPRPMLAAIAGVGTWCFSLLLLRTLNFSPFFSGQASHRGATDMRTISKLLFTDYLWPFEVLSLFLLVMIVSIFVLARPQEGDAS